MNIAAEDGAIPAKVSDSVRPIVMAPEARSASDATGLKAALTGPRAGTNAIRCGGGWSGSGSGGVHRTVCRIYVHRRPAPFIFRPPDRHSGHPRWPLPTTTLQADGGSPRRATSLIELQGRGLSRYPSLSASETSDWSDL